MNILRPNHFAKKLGMSTPTLWRRVKQDPDFPQPVRISTAITGFVEAEVDAYIELKVSQSRLNPSKRETALTAAAASVKKRAIDRLLDAGPHGASGERTL
jgi:prophage regulatory protein